MEVSHASLETGFSAAPYPPLPAAGGIISITNLINTAALFSFIRLCSLADCVRSIPSRPPWSRLYPPTLERYSQSVCVLLWVVSLLYGLVLWHMLGMRAGLRAVRAQADVLVCEQA